MCKITEGSATVQERGSVERAPLHHETLERREHAEEHKEPAGGMITETTWLLYQNLRQLVATLPEPEPSGASCLYRHGDVEEDILEFPRDPSKSPVPDHGLGWWTR